MVQRHSAGQAVQAGETDGQRGKAVGRGQPPRTQQPQPHVRLQPLRPLRVAIGLLFMHPPSREVQLSVLRRCMAQARARGPSRAAQPARGFSPSQAGPRACSAPLRATT